MPTMLPINGKYLIYGLAWVSVVNSKKEFTERTAMSRGSQTEYYVRYVGQKIKYGLARRVIEIIGKQPKAQLLSAAMLFSDSLDTISENQNSVLVQQLDDKDVAIIALLKGEPYLDVVVKLNQLDSQLASLYQEGHSTFVVYGNMPEYVTHIVTSNDLLSANINQAALIRFTDPLKKLQKIALFMCAMVIVGGYSAWKNKKNNREAEEAEINKGNPLKTYIEKNQKLLAVANFNGAAAYDAIWSVIKNREIEIAGWSLISIKCRPTQCEELWQQGYGSFKKLKQYIHLPQLITLQSNGESSLITYPIASKISPLEPSAMVSKDVLWIELITQQKRFKNSHPALVFTPKNPEIRGLTPTIVASSIPTESLLYSGDIAVSAPLGLGAEILRNYLPHVMINEISISNFSDIRNTTIHMKGTYYALH